MALTIPVVGWDKVKGSAVRFLSFSRQPWLTNAVKDHIHFVPYDSDKSYDKHTVFWILAAVYKEQRQFFCDRRAIIDVCLEARMPVWDELYHLKEPHHAILYGNYDVAPPHNVINVPNFFWYNESLQYIDRGYNHYQPQRNFRHRFLMPIGRKLKWRDQVVEALTPYLDDAYWSYVRRGRALPGEPAETAGAKRWDTRHQNPNWYNDTCYSVVLESITQWESGVVFVTEKTWKPISHQHPFMIISAPGLLTYLRGQGFETFDNMFDESYDQESDLNAKLDCIKRNIEVADKQPYTKETEQKLAHNFDLFYNTQHIYLDIRNSFIDPVLKFCSN